MPLLGRPILWYGFFFALGFFLSYLAFISLLKQEKREAKKIADGISTYILVGILLGARLFDVIFYENIRVLLHDPAILIRFWVGGLSSHGAVLGLIVATLFYQKRHRPFSTLHLLDLFAIVAGLAASCIRIGNFFNQEILGTPSTLPWAVLFGHPADGSFPVPRHPVQIYEAIYYLALFGVMWAIKDFRSKWKEGRLCGLFLVAVFVFRFLIEFVKEEQSLWPHIAFLTMGQWLSLPFIALGIWLWGRKS